MCVAYHYVRVISQKTSSKVIASHSDLTLLKVIVLYCNVLKCMAKRRTKVFLKIIFFIEIG